MPQPAIHQTEHRITVSAPAREVYDLIADVTRWPRIFPPTVHAEQLRLHGRQETIRLWATANGQVRTWTSRRRLDPDGLRVAFRQEAAPPPAASMGGQWIIEPLPGGAGSLVRLTHDFAALGDDPEGVEWISQAVDRNSEAELAALKGAAERDGSPDGLELSFTDSVRIDGDAAEVYEFVRAAELWPQRVPHVDRIVLTEEAPGLQLMEMDTRAADGSTHTTSSVRVCFPAERIVYKQLRTPALMKVHTGEWTFRQEGGTALVTSGHTVVIDPDAVHAVLGEQTSIEDARRLVRGALGRNSTATLECARAHVERRLR
ncbi:aromatase/cyclase [Spirillospora sp. NPDC127200]